MLPLWVRVVDGLAIVLVTAISNETCRATLQQQGDVDGHTYSDTSEMSVGFAS